MNPPVEVVTHPAMNHSDQNLKLFRKYCMECHLGQSQVRLNFMEKETSEELAIALQKNPKNFNVLDWNAIAPNTRMPPASSTLGKELAASAMDRGAMVGFLEKSLSPVLKQTFSPERRELLLTKLGTHRKEIEKLSSDEQEKILCEIHQLQLIVEDR